MNIRYFWKSDQLQEHSFTGNFCTKALQGSLFHGMRDVAQGLEKYETIATKNQ